jgi:hypothetical protein
VTISVCPARSGFLASPAAIWAIAPVPR